MKKIFIITGEASGDIHAGKVVRELKSKNPDYIIEGIGGKNLEEAGVKLFSSQEKMSAMGISPKIILDHFSLGKRLVKYLNEDFKPDLVLLIDYGAFNLSIAKVLKRTNKSVKIFYYIPPQLWASRKWRIKTVKKYIDEVLCIFPFEEALYQKEGINVHYCGHPLVSQLPEKTDRDEFFERYGLDKNKKLVSIFPGSRIFELKMLMKVFVKAAKILSNLHPDVQFLVSHAPNLSDNAFSEYNTDNTFRVIKGENHAMLSVSDALILASGTVALEAALYETPMIIAYRGPKLFYFIYLLVRCIKQVSLPNIILNKEIIPEIIQEQVKPDFIAYNVEKLLYDEEVKKEMTENLKRVKGLLSDKISSKEASIEIEKQLNMN